ncbi:ATPase, partial [Brachyspira hampsonii]|nr:ATPase [Brachyspira hampsonii]
EGIKENQILTAKNMKNKNMDINLISELTGLSIEEVEKL